MTIETVRFLPGCFFVDSSMINAQSIFSSCVYENLDVIFTFFFTVFLKLHCMISSESKFCQTTLSDKNAIW